MKTKMRGIVVLILIALGSMGCSSTNPRVYYLGDKAYAKNPETGKIMSWEHKESVEKDIDSYGYPRNSLSLKPVIGYLIETIAN